MTEHLSQCNLWHYSKDPPAVINTPTPHHHPHPDPSHGQCTSTLPTLARLPPEAHKSLKRKVQQWHCIKAGLRSPAKSYAVHLHSTIQCSFSTTRFGQHTGYLRWIVRKSHSILRTSWATGHQPPRQLNILPPTSKYLASIHPAKFLIITHIISPPYVFPCSTEWTWSSVPRSTHPPATRFCLSRSRPTHNNVPVYCMTTTSSELHASKILTVLLLVITKIRKINEC